MDENHIDDGDLQHRLEAERDKRFKAMRENFVKAMLSEEKDDKPGGSTPSQYGLPPGAKDLQDLIEYRGMNFAQGNIFKAQYRSGNCSHSDQLRDARKTLWFAQREVDRLEREAAEREKVQLESQSMLSEVQRKAALDLLDGAEVKYACRGHALQQEQQERERDPDVPRVIVTAPPTPCM